MKYQIYLQKDVSQMINSIAEGLGKTPAQLIKELIETNFRTAYKDAVKITGMKGGVINEK